MNDTTLIKDDMLFKPYGVNDGYQCKIVIDIGTISVRFGGIGLITSTEKPYEVWYPTESAPSIYQTADDIYKYIKEHSKSFGYKYEMEFIPTPK